MPLLMCPNDNAAMQTLQRDGVEFDMCPNCRGVWLDRGELEKIIAMTNEDERQTQTAPWAHPARQPEPRLEPRYERRPDDDRRYDRQGYAPKKKKGFDLFDIFD